MKCSERVELFFDDFSKGLDSSKWDVVIHERQGKYQILDNFHGKPCIKIWDDYSGWHCGDLDIHIVSKPIEGNFDLVEVSWDLFIIVRRSNPTHGVYYIGEDGKRRSIISFNTCYG